MSKQIRVSDTTYKELELLMQPRETFENVLRRLLVVYKEISDIKTTIGPSHYLMERPKVKNGGNL